ncbi:phosphoribosylanthranilate isomerase [Bordetella avium]|uniref:N-(5'-phosphoribosyl)anthranilate isomerase n=1 Tax=Bordetella avium (strain 197N) TaxID=360910 RepID=TRPF_BORA1|nr:phosphoribosylanthranilate isomerase [Bordetella avium]Q2KYM1.1 RecName: Full=N-(5'-phosphoribosyl)anthranilate isomerase; Short=PRAI [Bordetella avium 197N]AZY49561.1 phosphoribosylanthranilate isomerase [Bordetella avium]AZY52957.1 phosphoribosylanthranilate isomerase [Bordetella avium]RIQ11954.1 phosphoribosylanthranilate isomerase [Bordetella avium]RIQ17740.1 phosphoribosylanthranilate isomerase [Bordetella avium]RIQ32396.1 phosphoribosylanthranilate isomerase [Bordetella avium]
MRTRVKICGLTREADIAQAIEAGVDAIGLICYAGSKRYVDLARAARLRREVPAFVSVVTLFVNPAPDEVRAVLDHVGPDLLQFHGDESPEDCTRYGHRFMRAFRVGAAGLDSAGAIAAACRPYHEAAGWLFDSYSSGYGGSGLTFDHSLLAEVQADAGSRPLVLAGGLNPDNIAQALALVQPWAVDVSSGVESGPGLKSADKMKEFLKRIKKVDDDLHA